MNQGSWDITCPHYDAVCITVTPAKSVFRIWDATVVQDGATVEVWCLSCRGPAFTGELPTVAPAMETI